MVFCRSRLQLHLPLCDARNPLLFSPFPSNSSTRSRPTSTLSHNDASTSHPTAYLSSGINRRPGPFALRRASRPFSTSSSHTFLSATCSSCSISTHPTYVLSEGTNLSLSAVP